MLAAPARKLDRPDDVRGCELAVVEHRQSSAAPRAHRATGETGDVEAGGTHHVLCHAPAHLPALTGLARSTGGRTGFVSPRWTHRVTVRATESALAPPASIDRTT